MRKLLKYAFALWGMMGIILLFIVGCSAQPNKPKIKPNVIVILTDDAGFAAFGCYGGKEIPTPNIDALVASGVRFTNAGEMATA